MNPEFYPSFLPLDGWELVGASINNGNLILSAGGSASRVFTTIGSSNVLPEALQLSTSIDVDIDRYACAAFVSTEIEYTDDTFFYTFNTINGTKDITVKQIILLTANNLLDNQLGSFKSMRVTFSSSVPLTLSVWELAKTKSDVLIEDELYYGIKISSGKGLEVTRSDGAAEAVFNADQFVMRAMENGALEDKIYFDPVKGTYVFDGELSATVVNALSAIITPNLYAEKATIAEVTVDQLDTSDKVKNYLNGDKSPDNYQKIYDQFHEFVTGTTTGIDSEKVAATDRNGSSLYWTDNTYKAASTSVTAYPVYTYKYTDLAKMRLGFGDDPSGSGYQIPMIELGAGTGVDDNGKGYLYKGVSGLYLDYYSVTDGSLRRLMLGDDGIVLTPHSLDSLAFYANGFRAVYGGEGVAFTWTKDGAGRITSLVTEDNVTIPVSWNGGNM